MFLLVPAYQGCPGQMAIKWLLLVVVCMHKCVFSEIIRLLTNTTITHIHTHPFNGPFSTTTRVSRYQKSKTNLDVTEARDSEWQWHQLGHMQVCISLQTDNHDSTPQLSCPSCRPTNSVKALKAAKTQQQLE